MKQIGQPMKFVPYSHDSYHVNMVRYHVSWEAEYKNKMAARSEMKLSVTELQREKITKFIEDQGWTDVITGKFIIL